MKKNKSGKSKRLKTVEESSNLGSPVKLNQLDEQGFPINGGILLQPARKSSEMKAVDVDEKANDEVRDSSVDKINSKFHAIIQATINYHKSKIYYKKLNICQLFITNVLV